MIGMLAAPALLAAALGIALWPWTVLVDRRPGVRLLAALAGTSYLVVVLELLLGACGALSPVPLAASALAAAVLSPAASAALPWLRGGGSAREAWVPPLSRPTALGLGLGALAAAGCLWLVFVAALVPPYGWDALGYHLADVLHFARTRSLAMVPDPSHSFYYPKAAELHSLWFYLLAGGGEQAWRVAGIALLPLGLTAGVAARVAAEALGARRGLPWIVPGFLLVPVVMVQPVAGYVDVAFAAFVLASFAFAVLAALEGRFRFVLLSSAAAGLALGVKISFAYFGLPVLLLLAAPGARAAVLRGGPARALVRSLLAAAVLAPPCAFWYARNLLATGNPVYPHRIRLAGITFLDGPQEIWKTAQQEWFVPSASHWLRYPFLETFFGKPAYGVESGFGPLFAAGLLATVAALALAARSRLGTHVRAFLAIPITLFLWLAVNPTPEPRYVIACAGFALVALAWVAERVPWPERGTPGRKAPLRLVQTAVAVAVAFSALGGATSAVPDLGTVLRSWRAGEWSPEAIYPLQYGGAGRAFNWLAREAGPGCTVTYTNANFVAPLYGWHNRNRVVYAVPDARPRWGPFPRADGYPAWRDFLRAERVDWIVTWVPWWKERSLHLPETWIAEHPADFELVRDFEGKARIYRPVYGERKADASPSPAGGESRGLESLDDPRSWTVAYASGAAPSVAADPGGGLRIRANLDSPASDSCDLRATSPVRDWSLFRKLDFDLRSEPRPALLFVYLKGSGPDAACRFRIDLSKRAAGEATVTLDLESPEWRSGAFRLSDVSEVHLVLDDLEDATPALLDLRIRWRAPRPS